MLTKKLDLNRSKKPQFIPFCLERKKEEMMIQAQPTSHCIDRKAFV